MNVQKFFAGLTIVASLVSGLMAHEASKDAHPVVPSVSNVVPMLRLGNHQEPEHRTHTDTIVYASEVTIVAPPPRKVASAKPHEASRMWTCSAPRALENDAVQTVRECGWVAR